MSRPVVLSNGSLLIGLNEYGTVRDFYYPYVGLENLTTERTLNHKIGVWRDGQFSWLDDGSWEIDINFEDEALISNIKAVNKKLGLELKFVDFVDSNHPAFCRYIKVKNTGDSAVEVRLFMHQFFSISRAGRSDTALYVPNGPYILDFKGWTSLLVYLEDEDGIPFSQFAVGNAGIEGKEGTYKDAEDGELSGGLVEHGGVDSVMGLTLKLEAGGSKIAHYWAVASDTQLDVEKIHKHLLKNGINNRLNQTRAYWHDWLAPARDKLDKIDSDYRSLATKSLLIVKAHIDKHGGILASSDSTIYNYGRDYYSYVWPRDGAYAIAPLIELGYKEEPKKFFSFCMDTMHPNGYMLHKYQPDKALGSTWHPLLHQNHPELPIQEDETASIIVAINNYLKASGDEAFMHSSYAKFILPCADFLAGFIDATNLPHASYDLWEQKFATFSYTVFVTLAALDAAVSIAAKLNKHDDAERWQAAINRINRGLPLLINPETKAYRKSILFSPGSEVMNDDTVDASTFFGAFLSEKADAENLANSVGLVEERLHNKSPVGGVPRYEHDDYFLQDPKQIGNPWMITTLWLAQYYIKQGQKPKAKELIDWVLARASHSGILAEQADPNTGIGVGVAPLVWSHSTFLETVLMFSAN